MCKEDCLVQPQWERLLLILLKLDVPGLGMLVGVKWGLRAGGRAPSQKEVRNWENGRPEMLATFGM